MFVVSAKEWQEQIAKWAAAGAVSGAIVGALVSGDDRAAGALAGAVLGGVGAALVGYHMELQKRVEDRAQLQAAINGDAKSDLGRVRRMKRSIAELERCRRQQLAELQTALRRGTIDRETGRLRLDAIRREIAEDNELIRIALGQLGQRRDIYVNALVQAGAEDAAEIPERIEKYQPRVRKGSGKLVATPAPAGATGTLYVATGLRLRGAPSLDAPILTVMPPGSAVEVLGYEGEWARLRHGELTGYAAAEYLAAEPPTPEPGVSGSLVVDSSARPPARDDVERIAYESREVEALFEASQESLERLADDIEKLTVSEREQPWPPVRSYG